MPIHINQFNVELFNKPVQVNITEETTVIFGANGSGKSKLLEAISKHHKANTYYITFDKYVLIYNELAGLYEFDPEYLTQSLNKKELFNIFCKLVKKHINKEIYYDEKDYVYKFKSNENILINDYTKVFSFGEIWFISILIQILDNTIRENNILLIDTPETGLNVSIQHDLFKMFRELNPNLQIIAVSHSSAIVNKNRNWLLDIKSIFDINQLI